MKELATDAVTGEKGSSTHITQKRKRKRAEPAKKPRSHGMEHFRRAADRLMGLKAEDLLGALSKKALRGDLPAIKALAEFAEERKAKAEPKKKRTGPTAAQELETEEEWVGPMEGLGKGAGEWWRGKAGT